MHLNKLIGFLTVSSHKLVACAISLALAVGFVCSVNSLRHLVAENNFPPPANDFHVSLNQKINASLRLPYSQKITPILAGIRYRLFGDLGTQVSEGCPGWMFYNNGFHAMPGGGEAFRQRLALAKYFLSELRKSGAEVLVVTVPDKTRIETDALCGLHPAASAHDRLDLWQRALKTLNANFVDLRGALVEAKPAFFRTDVHWNERGAEAAAVKVADEASLILKIPGTQEYSVQRAQFPEARIGDLLVLAGLDRAPKHWRPMPDQELRSTIKAVYKGGLLDEPSDPEVAIVGSSSSRRSNFAEWLGQKLGRQIWNRSLDGGQFSGALQAALRDRERWPPRLRLIIWELPEMSLTLPLSDEEHKTLATLNASK
jgi:alginate O-acetyltransferase complex protein AlgJ